LLIPFDDNCLLHEFALINGLHLVWHRGHTPIWEDGEHLPAQYIM